MKVALINGHSKRNKGATHATTGLCEYDFNKQVIAKIIYSINSFWRDSATAKDFYRDGISRKKVAEKVNAWGADISIELHFNSFKDKTVGGYEALIVHDHPDSKPLASLFTKVMAVRHPLKRSRGINALYDGERGYENLVHIKCPAILIEPFFGSNPEDCMNVKDVAMAVIITIVGSVPSKKIDHNIG